ncbi:MAG: sigma 54-interacting transcriptional regulator [Desulfovibrio sp.]|uniref:sigma-54 interaction domain-containing protein n=1 Tax=Desulfovibrio sp. TaxID=885 RepID=UPI001A799D54|nr:sigma 54-interacting transcriptional regulator [Desulfovibrio sp.]MBD5416528.1 sigma 54-interacting transcriptional regulator [Desulfovibrio sp.]
MDKTTLAILKSLPFGVYYCDRECIVRYINEPYAHYIGLPPASIIGRKITDFIPSSRAEAVMTSGREELYQEHSVFSERAKERILVNRIPMRDASGDVVGFISQLLSVGNEGWNGILGKLSENNRALARLSGSVGSAEGIFRQQEIVTQSPIMHERLEMALRYAPHDEPVLITGATGVGKELFARMIQRASPRADKAFVCVNCAAIPKDFINSELFGYARGAFTGARQEGKPGLMELADKGTLFLDEIGELPLEAQGVLLRVLETRQVQRLNSLKMREVDFRLISATNRDLAKMVKEGTFREDLFFRISVLPMDIPPLREREGDLQPLIRHFLNIGDLTKRFEESTLKFLRKYEWPGNVRELRNALVYADIASQGKRIKIKDLPVWIQACDTPTQDIDKSSQREYKSYINPRKLDKNDIIDAIKICNGNISNAATMLGISRTTIYARLRKKENNFSKQ